MKKLITLILLLSFNIKAQDVKIGTQTWTSKNLDVSTYRNGDAIPQVKEARVAPIFDILAIVLGIVFLFRWAIIAQRKWEAKHPRQWTHYKCNSCQWTGTKIRFGKFPHCTSDNISSS